jgi:hypothetical protein
MGPIPDRIIAALTYDSVIDREMIALIYVFLTTLVSPFKSKSGRRLRARLVDRFG